MRSRAAPTDLYSVWRDLLGRVWSTTCALLRLSSPCETSLHSTGYQSALEFSAGAPTDFPLRVTIFISYADHIYNHFLTSGGEGSTANEEYGYCSMSPWRETLVKTTLSLCSMLRPQSLIFKTCPACGRSLCLRPQSPTEGEVYPSVPCLVSVTNWERTPPSGSHLL